MNWLRSPSSRASPLNLSLLGLLRNGVLLPGFGLTCFQKRLDRDKIERIDLILMGQLFLTLYAQRLKRPGFFRSWAEKLVKFRQLVLRPRKLAGARSPRIFFEAQALGQIPLIFFRTRGFSVILRMPIPHAFEAALVKHQSISPPTVLSQLPHIGGESEIPPEIVFLGSRIRNCSGACGPIAPQLRDHGPGVPEILSQPPGNIFKPFSIE